MSETVELTGHLTTPIQACADHILSLDHVAVAVPDLEASVEWYSATLGFSVVERRITRGASTSMISAVMRAGSAVVVLVQGCEPLSQVSQFVVRFGPGVQHIAFRVTDLHAAVAKVEAAGWEAETGILEEVGIRQTFLRRDARTGVRSRTIERSGGEFSDLSVERLFRAMEARDIY